MPGPGVPGPEPRVRTPHARRTLREGEEGPPVGVRGCPPRDLGVTQGSEGTHRPRPEWGHRAGDEALHEEVGVGVEAVG